MKDENKLHLSSLLLFFSVLLLIAGCGFRSVSFVEEHNEFGIKSAKMGLWNEAIMRWKRIVEMDPNNTKAHNNLAVAYEAKGDLELALAEYKTALELDPNNHIYIYNYVKFKKNYEKSRRKSEKKE